MADNPVTYTLGLDAESLTRVVEWASQQDDWDGGDGPFPVDLQHGDVADLGVVTARTREEAAQSLLEDEPADVATQDRLRFTQRAAQDGVPLVIVITASAYTARLDVKLERRLKIG